MVQSKKSKTSDLLATVASNTKLQIERCEKSRRITATTQLMIDKRQLLVVVDCARKLAPRASRRQNHQQLQQSADDSTTPAYLRGKSEEQIARVLEGHRICEKVRYETLNQTIKYIGGKLPNLGASGCTRAPKTTQTLLNLVSYIAFLERKIASSLHLTTPPPFFITKQFSSANKHDQQHSISNVVNELITRKMRESRHITPSKTRRTNAANRLEPKAN
ncbi:MAG: hypothetical protein MHMPM18_002063 [Marteilia pararefringens]